MDPYETYRRAAIQQLADNAEFQRDVHTSRGIPWGTVQGLLAGYLSDILGGSHQERKDWVRDENLVKRALTEILGEPEQVAWETDRRPKPGGTLFVFATDRAHAQDNRPGRLLMDVQHFDTPEPPDDPPF